MKRQKHTQKMWSPYDYRADVQKVECNGWRRRCILAYRLYVELTKVWNYSLSGRIQYSI